MVEKKGGHGDVISLTKVREQAALERREIALEKARRVIKDFRAAMGPYIEEERAFFEQSLQKFNAYQTSPDYNQAHFQAFRHRTQREQGARFSRPAVIFSSDTEELYSEMLNLEKEWRTHVQSVVKAMEGWHEDFDTALQEVGKLEPIDQELYHKLGKYRDDTLIDFQDSIDRDFMAFDINEKSLAFLERLEGGMMWLPGENNKADRLRRRMHELFSLMKNDFISMFEKLQAKLTSKVFWEAQVEIIDGTVKVYKDRLDLIGRMDKPNPWHDACHDSLQALEAGIKKLREKELSEESRPVFLGIMREQIPHIIRAERDIMEQL